MSIVELIPNNDVKESIDKGMKTVGAKLRKWNVNTRTPTEQGRYHLHDKGKDFVGVGGVGGPDSLHGISRQGDENNTAKIRLIRPMPEKIYP